MRSGAAARTFALRSSLVNFKWISGAIRLRPLIKSRVSPGEVNTSFFSPTFVTRCARMRPRTRLFGEPVRRLLGDLPSISAKTGSHVQVFIRPDVSISGKNRSEIRREYELPAAKQTAPVSPTIKVGKREMSFPRNGSITNFDWTFTCEDAARLNFYI